MIFRSVFRWLDGEITQYFEIQYIKHNNENGNVDERFTTTEEKWS